MRRPQLIFVFILVASLVNCLAATPPTYYPSGPQTDVPETDLVGWRRCWNSSYAEYDTENVNINRTYNGCTGAYLLYGCRPDGATKLTLLAAGERTAILNNTGNNPSDVTSNNGVDWYFYPGRSIGFAKQGDPVDKNDCDGLDGDYTNFKLCWLADGSDVSFGTGYRCGADKALAAGWTREIWTQDTCYGLNNGDECDDNDPCSSSDTCIEGVCTGVQGCSDLGDCYECVPNVGCEAKANGVNCTDNNLCTDNDTCQRGNCVGEIAVTCNIPQGCFNSTCSALTGQCQDECPAPVALVTPAVSPGTTPVKVPTAKTSGSNRLVVLYALVLAVVSAFN